MTTTRTWIGALGGLALAAAPAAAQVEPVAEPGAVVEVPVQTDALVDSEASPDAGAVLRRGEHEFGLLAGAAPWVTTIGGLDTPEVRGRRIALLALRYSRVLLRRESLALQYFADLVPAVLETSNIVAPGPPATAARGTAFGAGVVPLGARVVFRPDARVQPFVAGSGGVLFLSQEVPLPGARHYAFTGDVEVGLVYRTGPRRSFTGGIRFHHLSNGNTGRVNPGVNAFIAFFAVSLHR